MGLQVPPKVDPVLHKLVFKSKNGCGVLHFGAQSSEFHWITRGGTPVRQMKANIRGIWIAVEKLSLVSIKKRVIFKWHIPGLRKANPQMEH